MLKNAWNKVADILPEGVREYIEGARYIKMDGTPYHSKGFSAFMHRPEVKAGMLTTIYTVAAQMMYNGTMALTAPYTAVYALSGIGLTIVLSSMYQFAMLNSNMEFMPSKSKAIDREGRDLSAAQPNAEDGLVLRNLRRTSLTFLGILGVGNMAGAISAISSRPIDAENAPLLFGPAAAVLITGLACTAVRAHRLLTGEYVFCDKPPAKRQESKQSAHVTGGATTHQRVLIPVPVKR
jgi:hypothetical protein